MGYKVKRIMMWQNGVEKQVRPVNRVREYNIDFKNSSSTAIQNDGWSIVSGTPIFDASGMHQSTNADLRIAKSIGVSLANATKIVFSYTAIYPSVGCTYIGLSSSTSQPQALVEADTRQSHFNLQVNDASWGLDSGQGLSAGTYTITATFDIENKTASLEGTGKTTVSSALTDAAIASLISKTYFVIHLRQGRGQLDYVQDYNVKIYGVS